MLDEDEIGELADIFHLMGDRTRLRIILACLDREIPAGSLAESLGLSASLVSHHLRLLRAARILRGRRHGKQVLYAAEDCHVRDILRDMVEHVREERRDDPT